MLLIYLGEFEFLIILELLILIIHSHDCQKILIIFINLNYLVRLE